MPLTGIFKPFAEFEMRRTKPEPKLHYGFSESRSCGSKFSVEVCLAVSKKGGLRGS